MAIKVFDRVKETSITSGSGTITLAGASAGFQSFGSVLSSGDQTYYTLVNGNNWEVGLGTYLNSSLARTTVLSSTNSNNLINLSGNTTAFIAYPAEVSVYRNLSRQVVADTGGILFNDGTTLTSANISVSGTLPTGGSVGQVLVKSGTGNYVSQWAAPSSIIPTGIDAANIANGTVSNTEFQYLDGVTSGIQAQLNLKANTASLTGYYSVTNPSGFITTGNLSSYATTGQLSNYYLNSNPSGYATTASLTGYYSSTNPSGYITASALSPYYLASNPSGFITAATASGYYLNSNPSGYVNAAYVSGYQPLDADLTSLASASGTGIYYRSASNTWSLATISSPLNFTAGVLSASGLATSGDLSAYYPITNPSGYAQTASLTGYYSSTNPSGFITNASLTGYYSVTNPSGYITSSSLSGYVPYVGATGNLNLGSNSFSTSGSLYITNGPSTNVGRISQFNNSLYIDTLQNGAIFFRTGFGTSSPFTLNSDGITGGNGNNLINIHYGTTSQTLRLYTTYSSTTNGEYLQIRGVTGANFELGPSNSSAGGVFRGLTIGGYPSGSSTITPWLTFTTSGDASFSGSGIFSNSVKIGAYTLPTGDGINGQVLTTNGVGVVTWTSVSGGGGSGIASLNGLTNTTQTFSVSTTGVDFNINSNGSAHVFSIPDAGSGARGVLNTGTQTITGDKSFDSSIYFTRANSGIIGVSHLRVDGAQSVALYRNGTQYFQVGAGYVAVGTNSAYGFQSNASYGTSVDTALYWDATDTIGLRDSTNPQTFRIYNTYTSTGNFENLQIKANTSQYEITSLVSTTGANRRIVLGHSSGNVLTSGIIIPTGIQQITSNLAGFTSTNSAITYGQTDYWPTQTSNVYLNGAYLYIQGIYTLDFSLSTGGMVFSNGAELKPKSDNLHNFGDPAARWKKTFFSDTLTVNQVSYPSGSPQILNLVGGSHSGLPSGTENTDVMFNLGRTVQFASGNITQQRAIRIIPPTYSIVGTGVISSGATLSIAGPPVAGSGSSITTPYALIVESGQVYFPNKIRLGTNPGSTLNYITAENSNIEIHNNTGFCNFQWAGGFTYFALGQTQSRFISGYGLSWCSQGFNPTTAITTLTSSQTGILDQYLTTNPQMFRVANTFSSTGNYEVAVIDWQTTTNTLRIGTTQTGAGIARPLQLVTSGVARVTIGSSGYVTIGGYTLPTGDGSSNQVLTTNGAGTVTWQTVSGSGGSLTGSPSGIVYFNAGGSATSDANLMWNSGTANLNIIGTLTATSKSFLIPHPISSGKMLQYACLEGPENGVYVRGTTSLDFIDLPDYWSELVNDNITVNLTPVGQFQPLYVINKSKSRVVVGGVTGMYDYVVYGERKDINKLEVERWA